MTITPEQGLDLEALEGIIDRHSLHGTIEMLSSICGEKAEHVAVNWQDANLAKQWDKASRLIDKLAPQVDALKLS